MAKLGKGAEVLVELVMKLEDPEAVGKVEDVKFLDM